MKKLHIIAASFMLCVMVTLIWSKSGSTKISSNAAVGADENLHEKTTGRSNHISSSRPESQPVARKVVQPLNLPFTNDKLEIEKDEVAPVRVLSDDDTILEKGGLLETVVKKEVAAEDSPGMRLKSILAEDWDGKANLLVNALRAGEGFEINHDQLLAFISGKNLLGWPEGLRNWIGDELMIALRQDMPETAFRDLKTVLENPNSPAAMRDYSIQHISHLVTSGVIGKEGADYIWQTLEKNDPQTLSTALISLHRLSEQVPEHVAAEDVRAAAERLKASADERTRITAKSILKTGK